MTEIDFVRIRHGLSAPYRLWKSSLTLRVVLSAVLGSSLVLMVAGFFLLYQVTGGIVDNAEEAASVDANEAMTEIEQQMRAVGYDYVNPDALWNIVASAIHRGASSGRYQVQMRAGSATYATGGFDTSVIPDSIRQAVVANQQAVSSVPTVVRLKNGSTAPGLVVASTLSGGGLDRFVVYFVFSFEQEARTLRVVQTAVGLSGMVVLVGIGLVSYVVARQTLTPLRMARRAAERLAAGELTQLMSVKGTDDLAQLSVAMNHMANQLQQRIRQLEQLSAVQQRFVSDVSHELRTPLATVRMAADLLYTSRDQLPEVERRSVELLNKEVHRFQALLADLLEISRFDAGAAVAHLEDENINDLVVAEIDYLGELAASSGTQLLLHPDPDATARVDPRRVSRLIRNLLSNAIEHGESKPIDVFVAHDADVVGFAVRDHGIGFTLDQGKQLFNRFWRADPARARHIGGTGLGLSISQEDVRLHQGWIHAWGRPGQGAQFRVVLPRREDVVVTYSPIPLIPVDAAGGEEEPS
ncbi:MAG: HAMP domain-containing histidine kinase [Propionibacteriaceae bacterium]|nr:HAMP domain-containing histidine kinase [Propionibacteriaceae bacterium]